MRKLLIVAGAVMIGVVYVQGLRLDVAKKDLRAQEMLSMEHWARVENLQSALEKERAAAATLAQSETEIAERLRHANTEIENLRADVDSGRRELRLKATCPDRVPQAPEANGGDDGTGPRLNRDAESAYWRLREQHEQVISQVELLQSYAMICSGAKNSPANR